jgi:hypothetical protein
MAMTVVVDSLVRRQLPPGAACGTRPGERCAEWLAASVARWAIEAQPVMKQRIRVGLTETGNFFIGLQSAQTESFFICFGERTLVLIPILLDLSNPIGQVRCNATPLLFGQHGNVHSATPAIGRDGHGSGLLFDMRAQRHVVACPVDGRVRALHTKRQNQGVGTHVTSPIPSLLSQARLEASAHSLCSEVRFPRARRAWAGDCEAQQVLHLWTRYQCLFRRT